MRTHKCMPVLSRARAQQTPRRYSEKLSQEDTSLLRAGQRLSGDLSSLNASQGHPQKIAAVPPSNACNTHHAVGCMPPTPPPQALENGGDRGVAVLDTTDPGAAPLSPSASEEAAGPPQMLLLGFSLRPLGAHASLPCSRGPSRQRKCKGPVLRGTRARSPGERKGAGPCPSRPPGTPESAASLQDPFRHVTQTPPPGRPPW